MNHVFLSLNKKTDKKTTQTLPYACKVLNGTSHKEGWHTVDGIAKKVRL